MTLSFPIAETRKAFKSGESFPTAELGLRRDVINWLKCEGCIIVITESA